MRLIQSVIINIAIAVFISVLAFAQTSDSGTNHFAKHGLAFDYPAGWTLTDNSTEQAQQLLVTREGSSVQFRIVVQRNTTFRNELADQQRNITEPLVKDVSLKLGISERSLQRTVTHIDVGGADAEGVQLHAPSINKPSTVEVYSLRRGLRFVNLVFFREDADESEGGPVWARIRASLKVDSRVIVGTMASTESPSSETANENIEGSVLNGNATDLPQPVYPAIARAAHASGTVVVQVLIDEQGNVIAAHAISGHPLLQAASVAAAREAKFSPTLLEGEPVKVTGVIQYNFVAKID